MHTPILAALLYINFCLVLLLRLTQTSMIFHIIILLQTKVIARLDHQRVIAVTIGLFGLSSL
jgi:hypothetical protein